MKPTFSQLLIAAIVIAFCGPISAQDTPNPVVKVRFRLMSWDIVISDLNYAQDKKIIPVSMLPNGRSAFFEYQGTGPILFFREVPGPDGKPTAEVAATVPLSDFKERSLLLFFRSPTSPKEYRVQVIDDSDAAIPAGGYHFINMTKLPLKVTCASGEGDVPPGQETTVLGNPADGGQTTSMKVDAVTPTGVIHVYSNQLPFGKTTRTVVFVSQSPDTGSMELKRLQVKRLQVKRLQEDVAALPKPSPSPR